MQAIPTLYFQGVCDDALSFYHGAIGADILFHYRVADIADAQQIRPGTAGRTVRAGLRIGATVLYLADAHRPDSPPPAGFSITLTAVTPDEAARLLDALADGGAVQFPLRETAWAVAYGTVRDRFGVHWTVEAGVKHAIGS